MNLRLGTSENGLLVMGITERGNRALKKGELACRVC